MTVIPEVLPNGIVINKVNQMADDELLQLLLEKPWLLMGNITIDTQWL